MRGFSDLIYQSAAIPFRDEQVCMVTSRSGKRWVVPKGCLEPGKSAAEIALQEAWEEAGLAGLLQPEPVGSYLYEKDSATYHVIVYLLHVTQEVDFWPERRLRERCWLSLPEAAARIEQVGLQEIVQSFAEPRLSTLANLRIVGVD